MIALPPATGPDAGLLTLVSVRFGLVLMVSIVAPLDRVPEVPPSATVAVFDTEVVPAGAPDAPTTMLNVTDAVEPAAREPIFFDNVPASTGSGLIVTPFSLALFAT